MVFYRKHIKSMWAGNKIYLPRKYQPSPTGCLGGLLKYPGYQIAFTLWGYLIVHLAMFGAGLVFVYMVISPIQAYGFLHWLNETVVILANFLVVMAVMELQRVLIHFFFLQDKNTPTDKDKPLALNNRRAFHNLNYFLFFFNVMLGVMSCIKRLLYSTAIGLMLLPRIERAIMPQGYEKLDSSYCTWVGMIIADHHHSNPVLVCFCHLLLKHKPDCIQPEQELHLKSEARVKERVRIRWNLMYTLVRNPKLILMRKQDRQKAKDLEYTFAWAVSNSV
ncbi:stimulated by retinoic acid gene 6 protein-like isoform X1 [Silurus meridionalis]|uniref:stimulated by retinoic acid gene 6 protein-like isoform X1 n=2 Tax=Silurus meridionalis TaxID=175797 RepID=UPI001EECC1C0|nr:stimulated by retinoic acid gene 6 protein-like isoform X1 [Silurus meridionalis]